MAAYSQEYKYCKPRQISTHLKMKFVLIISCWVLASKNLAEAFVPSLDDKSLEFANSDLSNNTQSIGETTISFIERTEDFVTNPKTGGISSDFCLRDFRGNVVGVGNRCIDVYESKTANKTPILMYNCNSNLNQKFMTLSSDNTIRVLGKCLDPSTGAPNAASVHIFDCNGSIHQKWIITSSGQIVNVKGNNCLHAATSLNQASIHVFNCDGSANQKWTFVN